MAESKKPRKPRTPKQPENPSVPQPPKPPQPPEAGAAGAVLNAQQLGQIKQMLAPIINPHVQYSGDPIQMANAVIGNSQQAAQAVMKLLQDGEKAAANA